MLKTGLKDGPNKGKSFYVCVDKQGCDFSQQTRYSHDDNRPLYCIFRPEAVIVTVFEPNNNLLTIPWLYPYIAFVPFISVANFTILIGSLQTSEVKSVGYSVRYC